MSYSKNEKNIQCLDVGAYIGLITIYMSKLLDKNGVVHSFEPFKKSYECILKNISVNNLHDNIILNNFEVLDQNLENVELVETKLRGNEFISINKYNGSSKANLVMTKRLDSYLIKQKVSKIKICKIDAEGVDDLVLLSLGDFLKNKQIEFLVLENNYDLQEKLQKIIRSRSYKIFYMIRNKGKLIDNMERYPKNEKEPLNILCVSPTADLKSLEKLLKN